MQVGSYVTIPVSQKIGMHIFQNPEIR